jgi:hypothetical protein
MQVDGCLVLDGEESREVTGAELPLGPRCLVSDEGCAHDDRLDRDKATAVALAELSDAWRTFGATPVGVPLTLLSHRLGLDDGRHEGRAPLATNLLPIWRSSTGDPRTFVGDNMTCSSPMQKGTCGGLLAVDAQVYALMVLGYHTVAACYYGRFHGDLPAFADASKLGYCSWLKIPEEKAEPAQVEP